MALRAGEVGEMRRYDGAWVALHCTGEHPDGKFSLREVGYRHDVQDKGDIDYLIRATSMASRSEGGT